MRLITVCGLGACLLLIGVSPPVALATLSPEEARAEIARASAQCHPSAAWHHLMEAREAARLGKSSEALASLRIATSLDPNMLGAWLGIVASGAPSEPAVALEGLAGAARAIGNSWEIQRRLAVTVIPPIWTATILAAAALLLGIGLRHLPRLHHVLKEALHPSLGGRIAAGAATILCLAPLGVHWGAASASAAYAGTARADLSRREKRLGIIALVWIMTAPGVWKAATPWLCPADPLSPAWLIERVQRETPSPELIHAIQSMASSAATPEIAFAEGFMHRRLGRLREAEAAFLRARESTRPIAPHATVNLGNLRLWAGDPAAAAELYERVLHDPQAGIEARYNLAIALSRQHRFEEADKQLDKASRMDFERFRSAVGGPGGAGSDVADAMLSPSELWTIHARGRHLEAPTPPLLLWVLPAGRPEVAPLVLALAVLAGGLMGNLLRRRLQVHDCHRCGAPVCRRCVQRIDGRPTCGACAAVLGRLSRPEARRAALGRLFGEKPIRDARLRSWVGHILPGIGPILYGRVVAGTSLFGLGAFGALLFTRAAWAFPPSPAIGRLDHDLRSFGLVCILCAWALSVAVVRSARSRRPEPSAFEIEDFQAAA